MTVKGVRAACAVAVITLVSSASHSIAAKPAPPPDIVFELDPGVACDFPLGVEIATNQNRVFKEFTDKNGNVVRILTAGKGNALTFINLLTNEELSLKPNGSVEHVVLNADGTQTVTLTGHNVLILFPTDVPTGPSTTLHVGRVVFTINAAGVFTVQSVSGKSIDICAELT
jgi:hypothetical protein